MAVLDNPKHELFAQGLAQGKTQLEAYQLAGYRGGEAHACRLASNGKVAARVLELQSTAAEKAELTIAGVLSELWKIGTADPSELVEYQVGCCRYCWGRAHRYQSTPAEHERRLAQWQADAVAAEGTSAEGVFRDFDELGGVGFNATREPHPDCPECFGRGEGRAILKDTRLASADARALYAGVRVTTGGHQVLTHDKVGALTKVGQHLGMFVERRINTDVTLEDFLAELDKDAAGGGSREPGPAEA